MHSPRRLAHVLAAAAVVSTATVALVGPAAAQQYPPGPPSSPPGNSANTPASETARGVPFRSGSTVSPGQLGFISAPAGTFDADSRGPVEFRSTPVQLGRFHARADGSMIFSFRIPSAATAGQHTIVASGVRDGAAVELAVPVTVVTAAATAPLGLPRTGADAVVPMAASGVALVLAGAGVVVVARRRRAELDTVSA